MADNRGKFIKRRVLISGARLSFADLLAPKQIVQKGDLFYSATLLLDPANPTAKASMDKVRQAEKEVLTEGFGAQAQIVYENWESRCLHAASEKPRAPESWAGMMYVNAKSRQEPEFWGPDRVRITDRKRISELFVPGYHVNAIVDVFQYDQGKARGASARLIAVQFAGYDMAFSGGSGVSADDFEDCQAQVQASMSLQGSAPMTSGQAPAGQAPAFYPEDAPTDIPW